MNREEIIVFDEDMPSGICDSCGEECTATVVDEGIGPYEFWGSKGTHHDYHVCSPCCNAEVVPGGSKLLRRVIRIAHKDHKVEFNKLPIRAGDHYVETVCRNYREGGPSWFVVSKRKLIYTAKLGERILFLTSKGKLPGIIDTFPAGNKVVVKDDDGHFWDCLPDTIYPIDPKNNNGWR